MASMLCIPILLSWSLAACNLPAPETLTDGLEPQPPIVDAPVGPPVAATRTCDNRPADYAVALDVPWNALPVVRPGVSSEGFMFFPDQANTLSLVDVPDAPLSPTKALRIGFPRGHAGGGAPSRWGSSPEFPPNGGSVYVCVWLRMSANYSNNGNVGTKLFFIRDPWNNHYVGLASPDQDRAAFVMTGLQFRNGALSTNVGQVSTPGDNVSGGGWHKIEVVWQANTPGQKDGRYRQWVDGALMSQSNAVMWFLAGQVPHWTSIWFDPTFGGGLNPVPHDQWIDLDHLVVALK
jgi:hypothetical protein